MSICICTREYIHNIYSYAYMYTCIHTSDQVEKFHAAASKYRWKVQNMLCFDQNAKHAASWDISEHPKTAAGTVIFLVYPEKSLMFSDKNFVHSQTSLIHLHAANKNEPWHANSPEDYHEKSSHLLSEWGRFFSQIPQVLQKLEQDIEETVANLHRSHMSTKRPMI